MKKNNPAIGKDWERLAKLMQLINDNFRIFVSEIMNLDNAPFQNELDDCISNPLNKKLCIALPRGFGKTQHLSIALPLWEMAKNHGVRILLVSSTADISKRSLSEVMNRIERDEKYQQWAKAIDPSGVGVARQMKTSQKKGEKWNERAIKIHRSNFNLKDPTVEAVGLFGSILSRRADILIIDDLCNQQNSETEEQRQKVKDWFYTTLLPVLVPGGRIICLGNTWHMDDLMSNLLKDPLFDVRKRIPAIIREADRQDLWEQWANIQLDESILPEVKKAHAAEFYVAHKTEMDEGIELLWPKMFPYADLYLKRLSNSYSFARMYQCNASIRPNQKFTEEDLARALKKGEGFVLQDAPRKEYMARCTASGLDLAISSKEGSDDTALLTLDRVEYGNKVLRPGDYIIRNIQRGKFQPNEVREMVLNHYQAVHPVGIRVESNGYQESFALDLDTYGIPITSYHTGGEKNDPDIGVHSLAILIARGKLALPSGNDARTKREIMRLVNEMRAYPDGHTGDSLMALWFAFSEIRDMRLGPPPFQAIPEPAVTAKTAEEVVKELDLECARRGDSLRRRNFY